MTLAPVTFSIRGNDQAVRNLTNLEEKAVRRIVQGACRAGSKVVVTEARQRAPVRKGKLKKNIRSSLKRDRISGSITATVRAKPTKRQKESGLAAFYAHMVIGGARPHKIPKKTPEELGFVKIGGAFYHSVDHPGIRGNNFMEQAASAAFRPSVQAFQSKYAELWDREIAALPKGTPQ